MTDRVLDAARRPAARFAAAFVAAFAAALALLGPAAWGAASAEAGDPGPKEPSPGRLEVEFQPALPGRGLQPLAATTYQGIEISASAGAVDRPGSVVVQLHNPAAGAVRIRCRIAVEQAEYPEANPMARMVPLPTFRRLAVWDIDRTLAAGERVEESFRLEGEALRRFGPDAERPGTGGIALVPEGSE